MAINATPGDPAADSFATVAEFDTYQGTVVFPKGDDATVDQKERALKTATRILGNGYAWLGEPWTQTQALAFPRSGLEYRGIAVDEETIPPQLRDATAELAGTLLTTDPSTPNEIVVQGITEIKASSVGLKFKDNIEVSAIPSFVDSMIPPEWYETAEEAATPEMIFRNV